MTTTPTPQRPDARATTADDAITLLSAYERLGPLTHCSICAMWTAMNEAGLKFVGELPAAPAVAPEGEPLAAKAYVPLTPGQILMLADELVQGDYEDSWPEEIAVALDEDGSMYAYDTSYPDEGSILLDSDYRREKPTVAPAGAVGDPLSGFKFADAALRILVYEIGQFGTIWSSRDQARQCEIKAAIAQEIERVALAAPSDAQPAQAVTDLCNNCDSPMPRGCGRAFIDQDGCRLAERARSAQDAAGKGVDTITVCSRNEPDGPPWCAVAKWDAERRCYVTIDPMYGRATVSMEQVVAIVREIESIAGVDLGLANDEYCTIHEAALSAKPAQDGAGIEAAAKAIYELMPFVEANGQPAIGVKPPWYSDGNSNKQEEARRYARAALAAGRAEVAVSECAIGWPPDDAPFQAVGTRNQPPPENCEDVDAPSSCDPSAGAQSTSGVDAAE